MIIKKKTTVYFEELEYFCGLTLLSTEEYYANKANIPDVDFWWWTRTKGSIQHYVYRVSTFDYCLESDVNNTYDAVRPALILSNHTKLILGDKFFFHNHYWTVVSSQYALCDDAYAWIPFREDAMAADANIYEFSDIKKYLDNEWQEMLQDKD